MMFSSWYRIYQTKLAVWMLPKNVKWIEYHITCPCKTRTLRQGVRLAMNDSWTKERNVTHNECCDWDILLFMRRSVDSVNYEGFRKAGFMCLHKRRDRHFDLRYLGECWHWKKSSFMAEFSSNYAANCPREEPSRPVTKSVAGNSRFESRNSFPALAEHCGKLPFWEIVHTYRYFNTTKLREIWWSFDFFDDIKFL